MNLLLANVFTRSRSRYRPFSREVIPLRLVDPRFYHLDTCFCPLSNGEVMYYPAAFDPESQKRIQDRYPKAKRICVF
ncbi:MAG: hypothetical protein WCC99_22005 [Candidatus Sulfotelmatobacter sp.]